MAKIVKKPVKSAKTGSALGRLTFRDSKTGRSVTLHTVNADSKTFSSDLGKAFRSNVETVLRNRE